MQELSRRNFLGAGALAALSMVGAESVGQELSQDELTRQLRGKVEPLLRASVRIKLLMEGSAPEGSGTIVVTPARLRPFLKEGEVLIVGAGHVCADYNRYTDVKVHLFPQYDAVSLCPKYYIPLTGRMLTYFTEKQKAHSPDVSLLAVKLPPGLNSPEVPLASAQHAYNFGDPCLLIGCRGGLDPKWQATRILDFTPASATGCANVRTVAGARKGDSGGGLFSAEGKLIGVITGGDPVPSGTIDFVPPGTQGMVAVDATEAQAKLSKLAPDWAEYSTERSSIVPVADIQAVITSYCDEQDALAKKIRDKRALVERVQAELQQLPMPEERRKALMADIKAMGEDCLRAVEGGR